MSMPRTWSTAALATCADADGVSSSTLVAPTMMETTSGIVVSLVTRTATRRPSRMMARRSATAKTSGQAVADEDDRLPGVPDPAHQVEDLPRLGHAQRGGRLVHDDDPASPGRRPGDGQRLALAAGERLHRLPHRAQRDAQVAQIAVRRLPHRLVVDHAQQRPSQARTADLPAEEHVGHDVEGRGDREVLVDGLDARPSRLGRRGRGGPRGHRW